MKLALVLHELLLEIEARFELGEYFFPKEEVKMKVLRLLSAKVFETPLPGKGCQMKNIPSPN
jgi:hypothetical protein